MKAKAAAGCAKCGRGIERGRAVCMVEGYAQHLAGDCTPQRGLPSLLTDAEYERLDSLGEVR